MHGGRSERVRRAADVAEVLAEIEAAWPSLPPKQIVATALRMSYVIFTDHVSQFPADRALTAEEREAAWLSTGRITAIAEQAARLGVSLDVDAREQVERERGGVIAEAVGAVATALVSAAGGRGADQLAAREWVQVAVAAALRGEPVPECPRPWRLLDLPMLESGDRFRRREAAAVSAALAGDVSRSEGPGVAEHQEKPVRPQSPARNGGGGRSGGGVLPPFAPVGVRDQVAAARGSSLLGGGVG
jgi:hypothetical protein